MNRLTDDIQATTELIASLENSKIPNQIDENKMVAFMVDLRDKYAKESEATKKLLIEAFLQEIVIFEDRFDIYFKTLPVSNSANQSDKTSGSETCWSYPCVVTMTY